MVGRTNVAKTRIHLQINMKRIRNINSSDKLALEKRMVSPYISFMQIKALQLYTLNLQLSLKGSIVNLPVEINEMVNVLPKTFDEMSTIQIKLKTHGTIISLITCLKL